jgi:hypothetical protein
MKTPRFTAKASLSKNRETNSLGFSQRGTPSRLEFSNSIVLTQDCQDSAQSAYDKCIAKCPQPLPDGCCGFGGCCADCENDAFNPAYDSCCSNNPNDPACIKEVHVPTGPCWGPPEGLLNINSRHVMARSSQALAHYGNSTWRRIFPL